MSKPAPTTSKSLRTVGSEEDLFASTSLDVRSTYTAELVVALCGPIGSPIHKVADKIKSILETRFDYECSIIKLSKFIKEHTSDKIPTDKYEEIQFLIDHGNSLRSSHGNSVLADLAIADISYYREKHKKEHGDRKYAPLRVCHVIDSIKNQEELEALKSVYRDMLYFIGVFSPVAFREDNLTNNCSMKSSQVYTLIDRDSGEEKDSGQTVRKTFPQADFFLKVASSSDSQVQNRLERFFNILFGVQVPCPTKAETAMYFAASAVANSACLSRQVGAAVTDKNDEILAVGWNDVPKAKGGLYQYSTKDPLSEEDHRCMHINNGECRNDIEKKKICDDIIAKLVDSKVIDDAKRGEAISILEDSKISDLIEFSKAIHAEMYAIINSSMKAGNHVRGGKLYCTTYPCHNCARHIIAAGISEIYYIEPYRKSLATKLHSDDITENENDRDKVRILPFDGFSPLRYLNFFGMNSDSRKDTDGKMKKVSPKTALPVYEVTLESLPALEGIVVNKLRDLNLV